VCEFMRQYAKETDAEIPKFVHSESSLECTWGTSVCEWHSFNAVRG
jgi:hypothetical protein